MITQTRAKNNNDSLLRHLFASDDGRFLEAVYHIFLGRKVDIDGKQSYLRKLRSGYGRISVLLEVASSGEAQDKGRAVPAVLKGLLESQSHPYILGEFDRLEDGAFIRLAYRTILAREPDEQGMLTYLKALQAGHRRSRVLRRLRQSEECRRAGFDLPEIDRFIARDRLRNIPVLRSLMPTNERAKINQSLQRIESSLLEFRNSSLGMRLYVQSADEGAKNTSNWLTDAKWEQVNALEPSKIVTGNVAIPAKAVAGEFDIKRILILKLDHIGDFFVSVRPMVMLREAWPDAHITLVCGPWNVSLAQRLNIFDEIRSYHFFNAKTGDEKFDWEAKDWAARCDGIKDLDLGQFDLAVDLRHDADTRPILTRVDTRLRAGFASPGGSLPSTPPLDLFLLEIPADFRDQLHAETRLVALASLVIEALIPPKSHPVHRLMGNGEMDFTNVPDRPYFVVAPGAGSPNRTWPFQNFVALINRAIEEWNICCVLIGPPSEKEVNADIAQQLDRDVCIDLTGGALTDLPALVQGAVVFIGNDTGGGHLAALAGTPTLSVYAGVSDPRVWQPVGDKVSIVHSQTPCSYCHLNLRKDCRYELRCLTEITVDLAWEALRNLYLKHHSKAMRSVSSEVGISA